jgi:hypothetical protein
MKAHRCATAAATVLAVLVPRPACLQTDEPCTVLKSEGGPGLSVAFRPDGKTLATGCWYGTVELWEVLTGGGG